MSEATSPATETVPETPPPAGVPPLPEVIAGSPRPRDRRAPLLMVLAAAIAVGGIAFAAGRLTAPVATGGGLRGGALSGGQLPTGQLPGGGTPGDGQGFPGGGRAGGITISGTVTALDADSITIELASGTSVTIPLDTATTYRTATVASADAVEVGSEVNVTPGSRVAGSEAAQGLGDRASFGPASQVIVVEP